MVYPILVVEDDPEIARIAKVYLEGAGFRVAHADRGKDALNMALKETPLLVILDLMVQGSPNVQPFNRQSIVFPRVLAHK
jgi:DNA-binding response OmpR family regulator